jgi:ATP sulfurylase
MSNFYHLHYCEKCNQMTNHAVIDHGDHDELTCQKCKKENNELELSTLAD